MSNLNIIHSILQAGNLQDPILRDTLIEIAKELDRISILVDPAPVVPAKFTVIIKPAPNAVTDFSYTLSSTNVTLSWSAPQIGVLSYEIRRGATWDTATRVIVTSNTSVILDPLLVGTTHFLLRTLSIDGIYSLDIAELDVIIPPIGGVTIRAETLDSNVLLYWTAPITTFNIAYYIIKKDGIEISKMLSNFTHIKELAGGTFTYSITPVDIAGNMGPETFLTIKVTNPPDFTLRDTFISDFTLGVHTNTLRQPENNRLLALVNLTETFQEHFDTRAWASPQDQVDAGYPLFIQPVPTTGSYKEVFDIGIISPRVLVTISWSFEVISQTFNIGVSTRVSDDNISWSAAQLGQNVYFDSARYIEITINFTGLNDKAVMDFYNFEIAVSTKEEMDSGEVSAISTDVNGTVVTFNKPFRDVNSITESVKSTTEQFTVIHRFTDIPNPTQFTVFVYDTSGIRVSKVVNWKARGIV